MQKKLTKAEEEIMQLIWDHGPSTVSGMIERIAPPKPAQTTISSFVRILEKKGFLDHKAYGRTYEYFPIVTKEEYSKFSLQQLVSKYFGGSMNQLVSFIANESELSLNEIAKLVEEQKSNHHGDN